MMIQRTRLMGWSRVLETDRDSSRWFAFPKRISSSVRFGAHACEMEPTMQILPVRPGASAAPVARFARSAGRRVRGAHFAAAGGGCWFNVGSWLSV